MAEKLLNWPANADSAQMGSSISPLTTTGTCEISPEAKLEFLYASGTIEGMPAYALKYGVQARNSLTAVS